MLKLPDPEMRLAEGSIWLGSAPAGQEVMFATGWYHAFLRTLNLSTVDADLTHREHALVELVFADLIDGPLAPLPSGRFTANAAWLACAAIAHNLTLAAGCWPPCPRQGPPRPSAGS